MQSRNATTYWWFCPPNALDRCVNEDDWVRKEIALALKYNKNIIPVMMDGFEFPKNLPSDIDEIKDMQGVRDNPEYFDGVINRIEELLTCKTKDPDPFATGSIVGGHYRVIKELGKGGSSIVYLAHDNNMDMEVALKRACKECFADYISAKSHILDDFNIQKFCKHSGIANVHGYFEQDGEAVVVMDYIEGVDLEKLLLENGCFTEKEVIEIGIRLCSTLEHMHNLKRPLYHCDIKPSNILIDNKNEAILIDFGVSKHDRVVNIADTTALGTFGYAPPEQMAERELDGRTDTYSLGVTLYYALTGCNPAEPPYELRPVRQIRPELSKDTERIISKCIERDPQLRYQSAKELKEELENALLKIAKIPWYKKIFNK